MDKKTAEIIFWAITDRFGLLNEDYANYSEIKSARHEIQKRYQFHKQSNPYLESELYACVSWLQELHL